MIDHVGLKVSDFETAKKFYAAALAPIGYKILMEFPDGAGLGARGKPDLWISKGSVLAPVHLAFGVNDRKPVAAFHKAALKAGGRDNGKPGLRKEYTPTYYAAFVLDPDGNNIEVVCHKAPAKK